MGDKPSNLTLTESRTRKGDDDQVGCDLERQVGGEQDGNCCGELLSGHVKVLHNALELGGRQVLAIDVVQDVETGLVSLCSSACLKYSHAHDRKDDQIGLANELAFEFFALIFGVMGDAGGKGSLGYTLRLDEGGLLLELIEPALTVVGGHGGIGVM